MKNSLWKEVRVEWSRPHPSGSSWREHGQRRTRIFPRPRHRSDGAGCRAGLRNRSSSCARVFADPDCRESLFSRTSHSRPDRRRTLWGLRHSHRRRSAGAFDRRLGGPTLWCDGGSPGLRARALLGVAAAAGRIARGRAGPRRRCPAEGCGSLSGGGRGAGQPRRHHDGALCPCGRELRAPAGSRQLRSCGGRALGWS